MPAFPTTCPFCSCGCGFYLLTNSGRLTGVAPGESHPVSEGKLCSRGWSAHEAALWGKRIKEPLLRRNENLEPVSWGEALDHVTSRLNELITAGKPVGVLGSARGTNEENYLAGKLARAGLHTNNIDFSYHSLCRPTLAGIEDVCGQRTSLSSLNDIASSQTILLLEGNLAETHPRAASLVMTAVKEGAHLITIGYRITQMARLSSLHIPINPGDERAVIRGLLGAVDDLRRQDGGSAAPHEEEYEALFRALKGTKRTQELCCAAEWIVRAERATFLIACTGGQGAGARMEAAAFATLAAVAGHLDKRGSGLLPLVARSNVRGACDVGVTPDRLPGYQPLDDEPTRNHVRETWSKSLPSDHGRSAEELLRSASGLIVLADDPPSVLPTGQRAMDAIERVEFLVLLDAFVTPTVLKAHAVLPIASFAETEGTVTNMEGRVQTLHAAVAPPGEARPGWQVLAELCARFDAGGSYTSSRDVLREIGQAVPRYAEIEQRLSNEGWSGVLLQDSDEAKSDVHFAEFTATAESSPNEWQHVLVYDGAYDWGRDPLVWYSPTLSRDYQSERKLAPNGYVEVSERDVDALNLSGGRRVKLTSAHGNAVVSIRVRKDLKPGVLAVPYAFRDQTAAVLGTDSAVGVKVEVP
jgi:predicted molibdopterin-dependent oxidoreductase YjgC